MPGYTCKIVIEDTHPPVWRRVIIPDQITFFELHKIIQILFDWDDAHLHGFHIPSDDIVIDDEGGFDPWGNHYNDFDTNIVIPTAGRRPCWVMEPNRATSTPCRQLQIPAS